MKDLKSQLSATFGVPVPEEVDPLAAVRAPEPPRAEEAPILAEGAWRKDPWAVRLKQILPSMTGAPKLNSPASLGAQRMVTDQLCKLLKKAGRNRDARELGELRDNFMSRRDKAAWSAVKTRMAELELSDKAYRALKQGDVDPLKVLARLNAGGGAALAGMGAKRLVEALKG